eukprot:2448397-Rhodomonas_salina.1
MPFTFSFTTPSCNAMPLKGSLAHSPAFSLSINCTSKHMSDEDEEEVDIVAVDERARHNIEVMQDLMYKVEAFMNENGGRTLITEFQYWGRSEDGVYYLRRTDPWVYRPERARSVLPYREHVQPE